VIRAIVVGAVGRQHRQPEGVMIGAHQVVIRRYRTSHTS
jgi:hypothetical protein